MWNLANCKLKTNHIGHTGFLNTVTVSPDGSLCASGGKVRAGRGWRSDSATLGACPPRAELVAVQRLWRSALGPLAGGCCCVYWVHVSVVMKLTNAICFTMMIKRLFLKATIAVGMKSDASTVKMLTVAS